MLTQKEATLLIALLANHWRTLCELKKLKPESDIGTALDEVDRCIAKISEATIRDILASGAAK